MIYIYIFIYLYIYIYIAHITISDTYKICWTKTLLLHSETSHSNSSVEPALCELPGTGLWCRASQTSNHPGRFRGCPTRHLRGAIEYTPNTVESPAPTGPPTGTWMTQTNTCARALISLWKPRVATAHSLPGWRSRHVARLWGRSYLAAVAQLPTWKHQLNPTRTKQLGATTGQSDPWKNWWNNNC